jgi:hypothetical protein
MSSFIGAIILTSPILAMSSWFYAISIDSKSARWIILAKLLAM